MVNANETVGVFLPCRGGSERIPNKNVRPFCNLKNGLIELKLRQLSGLKAADFILISSNEETVLDLAWVLKKSLGEFVRVHQRDDSLCTSTTTTDELIVHAGEVMDSDIVLWTHVTSPFFNKRSYEIVLESYFESRKSGHDSLMTVNQITGFVWDGTGPINYDRSLQKWPFTQSLESVFEVNSGCFIAQSDSYTKYADRIGKNPFFHVVDFLEGFEIDYPYQFDMAETLYKNLNI
jgi:CMP-N-acetylneuraminic acid synthetase